jgi:hypothetical protein
MRHIRKREELKRSNVQLDSNKDMLIG